MCVGTVEHKRDDKGGCWARVRLDSGERILIHVGAGLFKISKLRLRGFIPGPTLYKSASLVEAGEMFFDREHPLERPLDSVIRKVIDCDDAATVCVRLTRR
jgi:hypothetical protein